MILDLDYLIKFGEVQIEIASSSFQVWGKPKNVDSGAETTAWILFYLLLHSHHLFEKFALPYYLMHSGIIEVCQRSHIVALLAHGQEDQLLQLLLEEFAHELIAFVYKGHQLLNRHLLRNLFDK